MITSNPFRRIVRRSSITESGGDVNEGQPTTIKMRHTVTEAEAIKYRRPEWWGKVGYKYQTGKCRSFVAWQEDDGCWNERVRVVFVAIMPWSLS